MRLVYNQQNVDTYTTKANEDIDNYAQINCKTIKNMYRDNL